MSEKAENVLLECYSTALSELLECYIGEPPTLQPAGDDTADTEMTAVVGLSDASISGTITISTCQQAAILLAETAPLSPSDWLGELGNQLAGRLKNKLINYGLRPNLSTPAVISGRQLRITSLAQNNSCFRVETQFGVIESQFLFEVPEDMTLEVDADAELAEEGSLQLF